MRALGGRQRLLFCPGSSSSMACSSTGLLHFALRMDTASAPVTPTGSQYGNFLVRVRAQVMTRDDSTGGWVPMGGGGLSNVSVRKRIISEDERKPEYVICGKRITDQSIVLSCTIKRDFQYNKVMPTFHHWITGDKKFGLTFQTAADARAFDKGVRTAVEDLLEGIGCVHKNREGDDLGDDDVFMTLDLPVESRSSTGSSSESANGAATYRPTSATSSLPGDTLSATSSPHPHHHLHRIHFMKPSRTMPPGGTGTAATTLASSASATELLPKDPELVELSSSYVQFASREHDYCYPALETLKRSSSPKRSAVLPPLLPSKGRLRCRLCLDTYSEADNRPGACRFGRDRTLRCIERTTCLACARCMLYHCVADAEGDFQQCACDGDERCGRRWTGLALLSLLVPCLWCYLPLRACHRCGVGCGYCGGKHESE